MTAFSRTVLKALTAAILTAAVLVFIFGIIAYNSADPSRLAGLLGTVAFFSSCLAGGIVSRRGQGNILCSIAFSVIFILVCFSLSLLYNSQRSITTVLLTYLAGVITAVIGGILFGGKKTGKPKSLKKYNKAKRK